MQAKISASVNSSWRLVSTGRDSVSRRIVCMHMLRLDEPVPVCPKQAERLGHLL